MYPMNCCRISWINSGVADCRDAQMCRVDGGDKGLYLFSTSSYVKAYIIYIRHIRRKHMNDNHSYMISTLHCMEGEHINISMILQHHLGEDLHGI